jgi:hypothetical protein
VKLRMRTTLPQLVRAEISQPVDPRVAEMAAAIAKLHGAASKAVLFYGSCLREQALEGLMLDFYLIVSDYRSAYGKGWLAFANRLIPPNVFPFAHGSLAAKFAVLSLDDFERECSTRAASTSVWARFAQPSRLAWCSDQQAREAVTSSIARCAPTLFEMTLPLFDSQRPDVLDVWKRGFALTYGAELRAERGERSSAIVDADAPRYERFGRAAMAAVGPIDFGGGEKRALAARWRQLQRKGKLLTLARLAKASTTFKGGIDYLAWKINRHAGEAIEVRPWQRRHPILGGLILLPRLLRRGSVR